MIKSSLTRRAFSRGALLAASAAPLGLPRLAQAQQYPSRPVKFVLPFGPGGVADITSRLAAEKLGDILKQRFVIENTPGPGGIAAADCKIADFHGDGRPAIACSGASTGNVKLYSPR